MKISTIIVCLILLITSCKSVATYNNEINQTHNIEGLQKDVDIVYKKLKRLHPKLYQYISKEKLDYKFDSLKQAINKPLTSKAFYKKLVAVVKKIGQGHISISPPQKRYTKKEHFTSYKIGINKFIICNN